MDSNLKWFEFRFGVDFSEGKPSIDHAMFGIIDDLSNEEEKIIDNNVDELIEEAKMHLEGLMGIELKGFNHV